MTQAARDAELVEEDSFGDSIRRADVYVFGVDGLLLVVDIDRADSETRANLVASAARDTGAVYPGGRATIEVAGNGYQVHQPGCEDAGFEDGGWAPVLIASGLVLIHHGTQARLGEDLVAIRARS